MTKLYAIASSRDELERYVRLEIPYIQFRGKPLVLLDLFPQYAAIWCLCLTIDPNFQVKGG